MMKLVINHNRNGMIQYACMFGDHRFNFDVALNYAPDIAQTNYPNSGFVAGNYVNAGQLINTGRYYSG